MTPDPTTRDTRGHGFTLLELSVVLIIIGLMASMTVGTMKPMLESARLTQTQTKLDAIEDALFAYRVANGRIPCPADITLADSNATFGVEAATPGTCTGGSPAANKSLKNAVEGGVPIAALGLPRDFAYDAWGSKLVYAVDKRYTGTNAFASYGAPNSCGNLIVKDAAGSDRTTEAMYVLVSHGPNSHGGYSKAGLRISASSANADEQNNCDCDNAAANTAYDRTYVQRASYLTSATNQFDDIVRFKLRWQWRAPDEKTLAGNTMCTDGMRFDGAVAGGKLGWSIATGDVNGDGIADLIIGVPTEEPNVPGIYLGGVYVFFGKTTGWSGPVDFSDSTWWNGTNGVRFIGPFQTGVSKFGHSVASGDVNSDGYDDIVISAPERGVHRLTGSPFIPGAGSVYVFFGKPLPWEETYYYMLSGDYFNGTTGVRFDGVGGNDGLGTSVAIGNVNGDAYDDIIMGAPGGDPSGKSSAGFTYVYFGKAPGWGDSYSPVIDNDDFLAGYTQGGTWTLSTTEGYSGDMRYAAAGDGSKVTYWTFAGVPSATYDVAVTYTTHANRATNSPFRVYDNNTLLGTVLVNQELAPADYIFNGVGWKLLGSYAVSDGTLKVTLDNNANEYVIADAVRIRSTTNLGGVIDLVDSTHWNGTNGVRFDGGVAGDQLGSAVASGDVNNDGKDDILMGAYSTDFNTRNNSGAAYVYFGKTAGWAVAPYDMTSATHWNGTNGVRFDGATAGDALGMTASGDVNGDGIDDVLIGAPPARSTAGSVYLYFGKAAGWSGTPYDLADGAHWNGTNGVRFDGEAAPHLLGNFIASSDINNDGIDDLILQAHRATRNGNAFAGSAYVYFGKTSGWSGTPYDLSAATHWNGTNGVRFDGCAFAELAGFSVAAGDVTGDGIADLLIGSRAAPQGRWDAGSVYLYFGKSSNWPATPYNLCDL